MRTTQNGNDLAMDHPEGDWTTWIITTILAALSTMIGTVVFLARLVESKYVQEIIDLKSAFEKFDIKASVEIEKLKEESIKCQEDRFKLAVRVAQLEDKQ